jgi:hypothetical protein
MLSHHTAVCRSVVAANEHGNDRLGRMTSAVSAVATNLFTYDDLDLVSESQNGSVLTRSTDALGRPAGIALSSSPYAVHYAYDA